MTILEQLQQRRDILSAEVARLEAGALNWTSMDIAHWSRRRLMLDRLESDIAFFERAAAAGVFDVSPTTNGWTERQQKRKGANP
jgi:hypothetical protein